MCLGIHLKCPIFLPYLNQSWITGKIFFQISNKKLHDNLSNERRTDTGGQTDGQI
jgi:hypothetical protein